MRNFIHKFDFGFVCFHKKHHKDYIMLTEEVRDVPELT